MTTSGETAPYVYAYHNRHDNQHSLVVVNNSYQSVDIHFDHSVPTADSNGNVQINTLWDVIAHPQKEQQVLVCRELRSQQEWYFSQQELQADGFCFSLAPYQHLVLALTWQDEAAG